ncbi:MAG: 30S ribosomal protein S9 [Elusimicrobia bacterium RIFCSPLOWO2_01_FULL_59_12]|nr:MAG: 30S ribosomal protein S9 [Elusimicrobia bacterium RIFCSPLOWO2_01_FULL_59_12]
MATATSIQYPIWATGRRKTSTARVRLIKGQGKLVINDHSLEEYFGGHSRAKWQVMRPFETAKIGGQYDIFVDVVGGGVHGQAGAVSHGLARAFAQLDNPLRLAMRKEGLLTRDDRMVERKKSGQPKARKRFQYSKR